MVGLPPRERVIVKEVQPSRDKDAEIYHNELSPATSDNEQALVVDVINHPCRQSWRTLSVVVEQAMSQGSGEILGWPYTSSAERDNRQSAPTTENDSPGPSHMTQMTPQR